MVVCAYRGAQTGEAGEMNFRIQPEVRELQREIDNLRHTILDMLPEAQRAAFDGYYDVHTWPALSEWQRRADDILQKLAVRVEPEQWDGPRAFCPLCGRGSSSPYTEGYKLGEGLWRHFTGWGNTNECEVFQAISGIVREQVLSEAEHIR